MQNNRPSEKMQNLLRKKGIPEAEIQKLNFEEARVKINNLIEADKKKRINQSYANPKANSGGSGSITRQTSSQSTDVSIPLPSIEKIVEDRLKVAIEIVNRQIPDAKDRAEYLTMVTETTHQIFAEKSMRKIQHDKESNMRGIK